MGETDSQTRAVGTLPQEGLMGPQDKPGRHWKRQKQGVWGRGGEGQRVSRSTHTSRRDKTYICRPPPLTRSAAAYTLSATPKLHMLKSRDITLPAKVHLIKSVVSPVVMYGCESWTIKKVESQRIDAFELWCWRRLLRVPWTARRSKKSILKEISPGCSLEGLMLKLKLQYFGHLMWRADSLEGPWCWEELRAGGEGDDRGWDGWMASPTWWTWVWVDPRSWWWTVRPGVLQFIGSQGVGHDWVTELTDTPHSSF